jgi:hypothetical protein
MALFLRSPGCPPRLFRQIQGYRRFAAAPVANNLRRDVHQDERALALSIAPLPTAFRSGMDTAYNIHTSAAEAARSETLASCSKNAPIRRTASDSIDKLAA